MRTLFSNKLPLRATGCVQQLGESERNKMFALQDIPCKVFLAGYPASRISGKRNLISGRIPDIKKGRISVATLDVTHISHVLEYLRRLSLSVSGLSLSWPRSLLRRATEVLDL